MGKHLMVREWLVQRPCGGRQQLCAGPQRYLEKRNVRRQVIVRLFLAKQASLKMLFFKNNCLLFKISAGSYSSAMIKFVLFKDLAHYFANVKRSQAFNSLCCEICISKH